MLNTINLGIVQIIKYGIATVSILQYYSLAVSKVQVKAQHRASYSLVQHNVLVCTVQVLTQHRLMLKTRQSTYDEDYSWVQFSSMVRTL